MNLFYFFLATSQCALLVSAAPTLLPTTPPSSLLPRSRYYCANIPGQVAGTFPHSRPRPRPRTPPLPPRAPLYAYCARGHTLTYVLLTPSSLAPIREPLVSTLISHAMAECTQALKQLAVDGPIFGGIFTQVYDEVALWVRNSNNHQLTWGVLGNALAAVGDFFEEEGTWGAVEFKVWDGGNEVAQGNIGVVTTVRRGAGLLE